MKRRQNWQTQNLLLSGFQGVSVDRMRLAGGWRVSKLLRARPTEVWFWLFLGPLDPSAEESIGIWGFSIGGRPDGILNSDRLLFDGHLTSFSEALAAWACTWKDSKIKKSRPCHKNNFLRPWKKVSAPPNNAGSNLLFEPPAYSKSQWHVKLSSKKSC